MTLSMGDGNFPAVVAAGDYSAATKLLDAAIEETRQDYSSALHRLVQLHLNRGLCNQKLHLNRKALKDYDAALALMPSNVHALLRKGQVLQGMGRRQEAQIVWHSAVSVADPASDLEVLLEIQNLLTGRRSTTPVDTAPSTPDSPAAAAVAGVSNIPAVDSSTTAPVAENVTATSAPPAPAVPVPAETKPHSILPSDRSAAAAGPSTSSSSDAAATEAPVTAATSTSSTATAASQQPKSKMAKGFFSSSSSSKALGTAAPASKAADAAKGPASSSAGRKSSSTDDAEGVVEIDCAAEQEQEQQRQQAAPGSFGAQVQQMAQNSVALQIAINQINAGQVEQAEALLDGILASNPSDLSALVARGTARALRRKLKEAVSDFSKAIEIEPRYPDTYKRRGQARSALGDVQGALEDLDKAAKLLADMPGAEAVAGGPADCYAERGMLYQKQRDYRRAVKELSKATELDPKNQMAWNYLGLCKVSMGDIREGCKAYEKAIELAPDMKEAWLNLGQALKEEGRVREADRALTKAMVNPDGSACLAAYRLLATMRQGQGRQAEAIKVLDKALSYKREEQKIELLYLRAICYHALGYARKAVADYEACMNCKPRADEGPAGEESRMFQFLSFYQREMALFTHHNFDKKALELCLDTELAPIFKECWCKKGPPSQELFTAYRMQPALKDEPRSRGGSSGADSPAFDGASAEQVAALTKAADTIGQLLQNHHQGFLPNIRQQRAAGYAAIELGQAVRALLVEKRAGREGLWVNSEGASGQGGCSGRHLFGWRDAMDIVVKWRQLSEPADQVVWVDLLTPREFEAGFGSHTPMYSGQTKCVRYYMNFSRALELAKECLLEKGHAYDAMNREVPLGSEDKKESVRKTKTALELYRIIGQDSWVVVPLHSILKAQGAQDQQQGSSATTSSSKQTTSTNSSSSSSKTAGSGSRSSSNGRGPKRISDAMVPPGCIEGTRLTLVKVPNQPDAVEFSIRTPVTPPRWKEFDAELEAAWDRLINAMLLDDKPLAAQAIMSYAYYWYNFMPLARGTAAVGYTTMLGLFWAAGIPITQPIPRDYQVDWEAILATHPQQFIDRLSCWFVPEAALPVPRLPTAPPAAANGLTTGTAGSNSSSRNASPAASPCSSDAGSSRVVADAKALPGVESLPVVGEVLSLIRQRLNALNGAEAKPV